MEVEVVEESVTGVETSRKAGRPKRTRCEKEAELTALLKVIQESPERISNNQEQVTKNQEVWKYFARVYLDGVRTDYITCLVCSDVLRHLPSTNIRLLADHKCANPQGCTFTSFFT